MFLELVFEKLRRALSDPLVELPHALVLALALHRRSLEITTAKAGVGRPKKKRVRHESRTSQDGVASCVRAWLLERDDFCRYNLIRTLAIHVQASNMWRLWAIFVGCVTANLMFDAFHRQNRKLHIFTHLRLRLAPLSFRVGVLLAYPLCGLLEFLVRPLGQAALVLVLLALALCGRSGTRADWRLNSIDYTHCRGGGSGA